MCLLRGLTWEIDLAVLQSDGAGLLARIQFHICLLTAAFCGSVSGSSCCEEATNRAE